MRYSKIFVGHLSILVFLCNCGEENVSKVLSRDDQDVSISTEGGEGYEKGRQPIDYELGHPLKGVSLVRGMVPGLDVHDSVNGKRYAYGELTTQESLDQEVKHVSGIIELEKSKIDYKNYFDESKSLRHGIDVPEYASGNPYYIKGNVSNSVAQSKTTPLLDEAISDLKSDDSIRVRIRVKDTFNSEYTQTHIARSFAIGKINVQNDFDYETRVSKESRVRAYDYAKTEVENYLNSQGVRYKSLKNSLFIHALVNSSQIGYLTRLDGVKSVSVPGSGSDDGRTNPVIPNSWLNVNIDGAEVSQGAQMQQFLFAGYDGDAPNYSPFKVAILESGVSNWNNGRLDWSGGPSRWIKRRGCGWFYCNNAGVEDKSGHSTAVTALIAADLTQEQDPSILSQRTQVEMSGYSPELEVASYALENGHASFEVAVDEVISLSPLLANISWRAYPESLSDCKGNWDEDESVNDMFESGIFVVKSAGNFGHSGSGCKISIPGSAIGSFTVGGYLNLGSNPINNVRNGPIYTKSSSGGYIGRNIVDISSIAYRERLPFDGGWLNPVLGTSFAAPTVTAAAANFVSFYEGAFGSTYMRNPGALTASMLLMGDRQSGSSLKKYTGYDDLWGAGRMLMRMFNTKGMDSPWNYGRYTTCVDHGETVTYSLNSIPADVDVLKVVAFWYDRRHDSGVLIDDIDLKVNIREPGTYGAMLSSYSSTSSRNEKERVFFDLWTLPNVTKRAEIELSGYNVTADNEGCGTNSNRVYIAWYYEDRDRDDTDGPGPEILN